MLTRSSLSRLEDLDWDFTGSLSDSPFSAVHWHPARMASQIATALIGVLSKPGDTVLDPFAGSGTVLVEAQRLGRKAMGVDLNPIACQLIRAKTIAKDAVVIRRASKRLIADLEPTLIATPRRRETIVPTGVQSKWYTAHVRSDLSRIWQVVCASRGVARILGKASFSAILLPVCRETRHWGYVCDNSTPKSDHAGDAFGKFRDVVEHFVKAYETRDAEIGARGSSVRYLFPADIKCADSRLEVQQLRPSSVHMVVTSPPYFGVSDYIKAQRLSCEWFGIDIEPLRLKELGARSKRHRLTAGGDYVEELGAVLRRSKRALVPGGACVLVIGESTSRSSVMKQVIRVGEEAGLRLRLNLSRTVSSQRRQAPSLTVERILFFDCENG